MIIPRNFYTGENVVQIARDLLGKRLCSMIKGEISSGIIVETEAYAGIADRASHAFGGRRTARTEIMYCQGGTAYVYLCYGIHSLFNIVTNVADVPHAVLIRGIIPVGDIAQIERRIGKKLKPNSGIGPGNVSKMLGIHYSHTGLDLCNKPAAKEKDGIWLEDDGIIAPGEEVSVTPRIGVDYAGEDALLPFRFVWQRGY